MLKRTFCRFTLAAAVAAIAAAPGLAGAQEPITLHGASQFNEDHAFTKTMIKFGELVKQYYGKPINFIMHNNSELGLEKQYFEYMAQGKAVDFGDEDFGNDKRRESQTGALERGLAIAYKLNGKAGLFQKEGLQLADVRIALRDQYDRRVRMPTLHPVSSE